MGDYTTGNGIITTSSEVNDVSITVTVDGQTVDATDIGNLMLSSAPINSAPYDCSGPTPVIEFATNEARVPITLEPVGQPSL